MSGFDIIRLTAGDRHGLREINRLFLEVFGAAEYPLVSPGEAHLDRLLADDRFVALTAKLDGEAVGALTAYELVKYEQERSELYIYDLAVREPYRRRGVARSLIAWVQDYAAQVGAWVVFVQADPPDELAVRLYESLGTREEVFHFDISPSGGDPTAR